MIHQAHPGLRAIMITSHADGPCVRTAIALGAAGYVLKPIDPDQVVATVTKILAK